MQHMTEEITAARVRADKERGGGPVPGVNPMHSHSPDEVGISVDEIAEPEVFEPLLFDSVSIHFNIWHFVLHFVINFAPHFFFFFWPCFSKLTNWGAAGFLAPPWPLVPWNFRYGFNYQHLYPSFVVAMIVSYILVPAQESLALGGSLYVPLCVYFLHRIMIGFKYATLSPTEYVRMTTTGNTLEDGRHFQSQLELITSWMTRSNKEVILFELASASARVGIDDSAIFFVVADPHLSETNKLQYRNWCSFFHVVEYSTCDAGEVKGKVGYVCSEDLPSPPKQMCGPQEDGTFKIALLDVLFALIEKTNKVDYGINSIMRSSTYISIINMSIPFCAMVLHFWSVKNTSPSVAAVTFLVFSSVINYIFYMLAFFFVSTAIVDARRRAEEAHVLLEMLRLNDVELDVKVHKLSVVKAVNKVAEAVKGVVSVVSTTTYADSSSPSIAEAEQKTELAEGAGGNSSSKQKTISKFLQSTSNKSSLSADGSNSTTAAPGRGGRRQSLVRDPKTGATKSAAAILNLGSSLHEDFCSVRVPRINLTQGGRVNLIAWSYARAIMRNYGSRWTFRIDAYVVILSSSFFTICIVTIVLLYLSQAKLESSQLSFESPIVLQSLISTSLVIAFLVYLSISGVKVNNVYDRHRWLLESHLMRVENTLAEISMKQNAFLHLRQSESSNVIEREFSDNAWQIKALSELQDGLRNSQKSIRTTDELHPFSLCGIAYTPALTSVIVSSSVTILSTLFAVFSSATHK